MKKKDKPKDGENIYIDNFFAKRWWRRLEAFIVTVLSIGVMGGIGYGLDTLFKTNHTFLIIGIVVSFFLTQFILIKRMLKKEKQIKKKQK